MIIDHHCDQGELSVNVGQQADVLRKKTNGKKSLSFHDKLMGHSCKIGNAPNFVGGKGKISVRSVLNTCMLMI